MIVEWHTLSNLGEDIKEYLEKRYEDYCKDKNENSSTSGGDGQFKRHIAKQMELISFGIELYKKLHFFLGESRKKLFEQAFEGLELTDKFYKGKYDKFCKELEENNKARPFNKQEDLYEIHRKESDVEELFFNRKEKMKNKLFIKIIDERRADYEKKKADREKRKDEYEKRLAKEIAREERIAKKKGHSNIKPIDFYERLYCRYGAPFGMERFCIGMEEYEIMQQERDWDLYFEEKGIPSNYDYRAPKEKPFKYKLDSPEDNQKYLDRCKQLFEVFKPLAERYDDDFDGYQAQINIYQEYLDKGYLITRQIANLSKHIGKIFWYRIDRKTRGQLSAFSKQEYKINIFDDESFNIEESKIKVNKFTGGEGEGEVEILTPIDYLKKYLKKHGNRITAKEYSTLTNQSYKMALVILKNFVVNKELKSKKEERGLNIFYD